MTLPDLATLRRLHEQATKLEWLHENETVYALEPSGEFEGKGATYRPRMTNRFYLGVQGRLPVSERRANAELIAASRNALPDLLDAFEFRAQVQGMRARIVEQALDHSSRCAADSDSPAVEFDTCERCLFFRDLLALIDAPSSKET